MMAGHSRSCMLGMEDRVDDQLADVIVLEPVDDLRARLAGADQPRHAQFGEVLRHRRCRLGHIVGEFVDRMFAGGQRPQNLDAGVIGKHTEDLDDQVSLFVRKPIYHWLLICIHTRILALCAHQG